MTPTALLDHLDTIGVELWLENDTLRFRAPHGALTADLKEKIKQSRTEIMHMVRERSRNPVIRDRDNTYEPFPLTDVQGAYLVGRTSAFSDGGVGCHGYAEFDIDPALLGNDPADALTTAWQHVVKCHPMLRAIVHAEGWQQVIPELDVPLVIHPATERERVRERLQTRIHPVATGSGTNPADLEPLIDIVATIGIDDIVLHLSVDLLLTDYVGLSVILADLESALTGHVPQPPSLTFRDYLATVRAYEASLASRVERERAERFWTERFSTDRADELPDPITLAPEAGHPADPAPAPHGPVRFTRRSHLLSADHWRRLESIAREQGVTTTSLLVAALGRVLHRHGGPARGLVAMTVADRRPVVPDVARIVGDFTSTVLVEVDGQANTGLTEAATTAQNSIFDALEHRALSGVELARLVAQARGEDRFSAPVVVTSTIGASDTTAGTVLRPRPGFGLSQTPQVLLDVQFSPVPGGGGISLDWDCRDGGFSGAVLDDAFADFTALVDSLVSSGIPHGDPLPRKAPLPIPRSGRLDRTPATLHKPILQRWAEDPCAPAIVDGHREVTRDALVAAAAAVARWLKPQMGREVTTRVAVSLPPGAAQIAVELGILMTGGCYVPVEPDWPSARRKAVMQTLRAEGSALLIDADSAVLTEVAHALDKAAVTPSGAATGPNGTPEGLPEATRALSNVPSSLTTLGLADIEVDPDSEAYVIFTSGSTGTPKGVVITHRQARTTLADVTDRLHLGPADTVLAVSRHSFDLSVFNAFGMLGAGGRVVIPSSGTTADPQTWAAAVSDHRVTVWNSVPAQLQLLLDHLAGEATGSMLPLRAALVSGDWVPVTQPAELWRYAPSARFFSLGGATEAAIWSVFHEVTRPLPDTARSIPYGTALDDQGIWVMNAEDEPAGVGQIGQLVIGGDGVAQGYLGDPERTSAAFFTHPGHGERCYRTGDTGRLLPDGQIEFLGRVDGQVKIRGHRIELGEIESVLSGCEGVSRAVAAVAHSGATSLVVAVLPESSEEYARHSAARTDAVIEAMQRADRDMIRDVDADALIELAETVEDSAVRRMTAHVARGEGRTVTELIEILEARPHRDLVERWVSLLVERGWVTIDDGLIRILKDPDLDGEDGRWHRIYELDQRIGYGVQQLDYVRQCLDDLPGLLTGTVDPLALLFPEGNTDVARAAYGHNLFSRWINTVIAAGITERVRWAHQAGRTLRILEIGAGVGGTTAPVLEALTAELGEDLAGVDYLFTDVSPFFFDEITARWPQLRTGLLNINDPAGIVPGSVDVILSANVLHNARDIPETLRRMAALLAPGGALAFIDSTAVNAALMTSMEFKEGLTDFADLRVETGSPFLSLDEWHHVLHNSPFHLAGCFPAAPNHPMRIGHQHAMWATTGDDRAPLDAQNLIDQLAQELPRYMVPQMVAVVDEIPLTRNGKVNRAEIAQLANHPSHTAVTACAPVELDPTEHQVAAIWRDVLDLGVTPLTPDADFFDLGGDSLLLARCIGRMRRDIAGAEAVAWDDALRRIVADPTIAGCAQALGTGAPHESDRDQEQPGSVTELLPAVGVEDHVLVLVHDGSGGLGPYRDVITSLERADRRPRVLGLHRVPGDGYLETAPDDLLDHLADRYTAELVALGIQRVHLFGYCMGGLIAAGVATRLAEAGIDVSGCTVVSSYRIPFAVQDDLLLDHSLAKLLHRNPADAGIDIDEHALGRALTAARRENPTMVGAGSIRRLAEPGLAADIDRAPVNSQERLRRLAETDPHRTWTPETLRSVKEIFKQSLAAVATWQAPPYLGRICFLRQRGDLHFLPTLREDMTEFWSEFCLGELEIRDIDGTHFDCLRAPNADAVVAGLAREWVQ
ncbi:non-ribosomal peptide synthetase [Devriesea agamarum]|uniref:non-ribosomal peptide synthetase n=1 Tax=Devriesea agamarum TaxID=472569 RepID=UPI00071E3473|nr:non-ribosomal peptide synthetase [Devriesea agamarum]